MITKDQFVSSLAEELKVSKAEALRNVDGFFKIVEEKLKQDEDINLTGFGKFSVSERAAREGRNPRTGESIQIKACKIVSFKAGANLKKEING